MDKLNLTNKNQELVVNEINEKLQNYIENVEDSGFSSTFVPQYDSILNESDKSKLVEIKLDARVEDLVKKQSLNNNFKQNKQ